jgi:hypothetical protein
MKVVLLSMLLSLSLHAAAQNSPLRISNLTVTDIVDAEAQAATRILVQFHASDPSKLERLELILQDPTNPADMIFQIIGIEVINGVAHLKFEKNNVAFEGQTVKFLLNVRDQIRQPYHVVSVKAFDVQNRDTNQLFFERFN